MSLTYQPVIIIGAARSGTRLLRDTIARHPDVDKVPFDINYVWRLGNESLPHDEIPPQALTPGNRARIQKNIARFQDKAPILIEKTVRNCLRVPFVAAVYPGARFIHLLRHGEDVVESVYRQWQAPPDWRYIIRKARTYPLLETPGYALRYIQNIFKRSAQQDKKSAIWGPLYQGIHHDLLVMDLWEICAIQWTKSIQTAYQGFEGLDPQKICSVRYEDFVGAPDIWLRRIARFLEIDPSPYHDPKILENIATHNIGKARTKLSFEQKSLIKSHLEPAMGQSRYSFYT